MNDKEFSTPILFLIFNRPRSTEKVFQRIRDLKPRYLYVSADGPRSSKMDDAELCIVTRKIVENVDWNCDVKTNFSDINLGCKIGVSSGINWFFDHVEEGIILEDDCLPDPSFFRFCEKMLHLYQKNEKIMHIGGTNFQDGVIRGNGGFYFSALPHVWGWATWKRAWRKYDVAIKSFPELLKNNQFDKLFVNDQFKQYWVKNFELVFTNQKDTWDIQWMYSISINHGLTIIPNSNLVSNIGFESGATHTFNQSDPMANRPLQSIEEINFPTSMAPDNDADFYTFRKYLSPNKFQKLWRLICRHLQL